MVLLPAKQSFIGREKNKKRMSEKGKQIEKKKKRLERNIRENNKTSSLQENQRRKLGSLYIHVFESTLRGGHGIRLLLLTLWVLQKHKKSLE